MYIDKNKNRWYTYKPRSGEFTRISRGMLDTFLKCPRCFYLQKVLGVKAPHIPFNLNIAVDTLMKKEFDYYRNLQQTHPSIKKMGLEFIPYKHKDFFDWRGDEEGNYYGFGFEHAPTRIELCGKIDDVWRDDNGTLYIVDYKAVATSDSYKLTMEYKYNQGYKRQIEVYQWIFRQNGFNVSDTGYIVFVNAQTDPDYFDNKLEFLLSIEEVRGDCFWVEKELENIRACIDKTSIPESSQDCDICQYYNKRLMATNHK